MRWGGSRVTRIEYRRVDFPTFAVLEPLTCFGDGGQLTESLFTSLRVSGQLPFRSLPDLGNDMVRIFITVEDADGATHSEALATMFPTSPKRTKTLRGDVGSVDLYSTLYLLQARKTREPLTLPAGTVAVSYASSLAVTCGLPVVADASAAALNVAKSYDALTSYLEIVNDLLEFAGFAGATVDGMGNVVMRKYVNPSKLAPTYEWTDGAECVYQEGVEYEYDTWGAPNAYTCISSPADGAPLVATATNDDPGSAISTVTRGYVVDAGETVSDIEDAAALAALAERRLADATSNVESITIRHLWAPFDLGAVLRITQGVESWQMASCSRETELRPAGACTTRLRRFLNA